MKNLKVSESQYKIVELLGHGSHASVYRAFRETEDAKIRMDVAIKVVHSDEYASILKNEFERLRQIRSPRCVSLLGWEPTEFGLALVLEFVNGVNLNEISDLSSKDIEQIRTQVFEGLSDLSSAGLCHGDLSPQNILIDTSGQIKLIDFGLIKNGRQRLLTPKYASPTLLAGEDPSRETDLFSFSVIENELSRRLRTSPSEMSLGEKVVRALERRRSSIGRTAEYLPAPETFESVRFQFRRQKFIGFLMAAFLVTCQTGSNAEGDTAVAHFAARASKWVELEIDGRKIGFLPIEVSVPTGRAVQVRWKTRFGLGHKRIWPKPDEKILLDDKIFFNKTHPSEPPTFNEG
jgi:serine/threonine protein kinase